MLRVWTKWYNAFNTGQISVLGSSMWGCGGAEKQRDRNSITLSPLLSSPLLLSLHFLIFSHFLTFVSSPSLRPTFPQISCTSSPVALIRSQPPSSLISSLLYPISSIHPAPIVTFSLHSPPFSALPRLSLQSNLQICIHIQNLNNFKHSDRKHWNTYCSAHKDTQFKLITSFFKQKTGGKCVFLPVLTAPL